MASTFLNKIVRFIGWLVFIVSLLIIIAGIVSITSSDNIETFDFWLIGIFTLFAVFGFFLTRYKKVKNPEIEETLKKTIVEKPPETVQNEVIPPVVEKPNATREILSDIKDINEQVKILEQKIRQFQESYYNGEIEVSDDEFDLFWNELKTIDPNNPALKAKSKTVTKKSVKTNKDGKNVYSIVYLDSSGKASSRDIEINSFLEENGKLYIYAYCYLREQFRQFSVDRVASISLKGGDPIDNPHEFLRNKYQKSGQ